MKYIETIKIVDGVMQNLQYHHKRMVSTVNCNFDLKSITTPSELNKGVVKCRILYDYNRILDVTFSKYKTPNIKSLKSIECNHIEYSKKSSDRVQIDSLFAQREECDDILIIKDGFVTDTSFCNVVFEKSGKLFTPTTPLLSGTKRANLIDNGFVSERIITQTNIFEYEKIHLINAMIDLNEVVIDI